MQNSSGSLLKSFGRAHRSAYDFKTTIILLFIGAIFVGVGYLFVKDDFTSIGRPSIEGTVTEETVSRNSDGDIMYTPTVSYEIDGTRYAIRQGFSTGQKSGIGSKRQVYYNPSRPSDAVLRTSGSGYFVYIFPLVGIASMIFSIYAYIASRKRSDEIAALKQNGIKIQGIVTNLSTTSSGNRGSTIKVTISAIDQNGQTRDFLSDDIAGNTFAMLDYQKNPVAMDVYIDPVNSERYYVDIDDIPTLTPEKIKDLLMSAVRPSTQSSPQEPIITSAQKPLPPSDHQPPSPIV